ncbi:hypothetical protein [Chamaesiphon sp. OTE_75_metabat_556]|uniref:hypothetical protein n=1 Tax=Chamaesiphon sp. OTE_75_metabat_556 TaxID=2964692 RepID=UPI00286AF1D7|nr:hypothetical protein [Chamaesiphon sp. OTE_75_metabat_556]
MDIALLVNLLAPALPVLLGLGQKAIDKGAEKLGEKGAEGLVGKMWQLLKPKVEAKPGALDIAKDVANDPENKGATSSLEYQLQKILEAPENKDLAAEISKLLAESEEVKGSKYNVTIGDDAIVGAIGDKNTVTQHIGTKP